MLFCDLIFTFITYLSDVLYINTSLSICQQQIPYFFIFFQLHYLQSRREEPSSLLTARPVRRLSGIFPLYGPVHNKRLPYYRFALGSLLYLSLSKELSLMNLPYFLSFSPLSPVKNQLHNPLCARFFIGTIREKSCGLSVSYFVTVPNS